MKIDAYNSRKLSVLSFLMIVAVLYIHSFYNEAMSYPFASFVQNFVGNGGLTIVAVPLFYVMSGFLFFYGVSKMQDCFPKIRKRARTLLVPYILWNVIFVLWYVVLQNVPGIGGFVNSDIVGDIFGGSLSNALFELFVAPASFPLWFLRDLIIIVLFSPLLYLAIRYGKWITIIVLFLIMPFLLKQTELFNQFGLAYFVLGACIALHSSLEKVSQVLNKPVFVISIIVYIGHAFMLACGVKPNFVYLGEIAVVAAIISIWKGYDLVVTRCPHILSLNSILGYSFFIYLFHEPVFNIIKKIGLKMLGIHEWSLIALYLINPIIMCAIAIAVAKVLQKYLPKVYGVLVGGR